MTAENEEIIVGTTHKDAFFEIFVNQGIMLTYRYLQSSNPLDRLKDHT